MRRSRSTRAASALVIVLVLGAGACASSDLTVSTPPADVTEAAPPTESAPTPQPATPPPTDAAVPDDVADSGSVAVGLGPTDVMVTTTLPLLQVDWTTTTLDLPEGMATGAWLASVSVVDEGFTAVAFAWEPPPGNQTVYTWRSPDGTDWTRSELSIPAGQSMNQVFAGGDLLAGVGQEQSAEGYQPVVWFADSTGGWDRVDLSSSGLDLVETYVVGAAATEAGIVLGARRERFEATAPVAFETEHHRFELDDIAGTYMLSELGTGRTVTTGAMADIYPTNVDGQAIHDTATGELLTVVPWSTWEGLYALGSPLPVPIPIGPEGTPPGIIEWDGYRIVVDDANDRFSVVDVETGAEITSGPASDLYRGPPPSFIDVATGEVAVSFSWSEWDELLNSAYDAAYSPHDEHESEHLILFSPDGRDWSEQLLTSGTNIHLESVAAVDDAFVVSLVEHSELGATRIVYTSNDGVDWMEATGDGPEYLDRTSVGPEGVIAMSYDEERSALATSADGRWWNTELSMVPQDDGRDGWLRLVASGDLGHAALATLDAAPGIEVLTITVDGRTARFDAPFSAVQIVDDPTGEILLDLSWDEAQEAVELGEPAYASYAEGATSFWSPDGTLLMTITDDRAQQAFDEQVMRYEAGIDHVLFVRRDEQWFEADVPEATGLSPEQLAVGTDAIVVGTIHSRSDGGTDPVFNEIVVWLGRIG